MTADDFREIALSVPGATEQAHMGHPDFRANGRIFATLRADERSGALKLSPDEQQELMRTHPKLFTAASGAWGRQGWTMIRLAAADRATARGALLLAWQNVAAKPRQRPSTGPRRRTARPASRKRRTQGRR
ncbi:MAG TPA: MmcQ/YjbR family DNA-binding protein [Vicinamibacterales bacterium]|nr:MmcQ/YjbR family DNA-binding protein [Vicinamibacterales bacterium]